MSALKELNIFTDGGARRNPGPAAIAVIIYDDKGELLESHSEFIGVATNNVAEYRAVLKALKLAKKYGEKKVTCTLDSELVASQLAGKYKIKKPHLRELYGMVKEEEKKFGSVRYAHVRRNDKRIKIADGMLNRVLDRIAEKKGN